MQPIGIRREDKKKMERRTPLIPAHAVQLLAQSRVPVSVQTSAARIYSDEEYQQAQVQIVEDLEACPIILGVKEVALDHLRPDKTYLYFSHTIKGQAHNMPMLRRLLELRCTLIDYEKIVDEAGRRLVFFGRFAGYAGMIDSLALLGQRFKHQGYDTPFSSIKPAYQYATLEEAKAAVAVAGQKLRQDGLPTALAPLTFGITGYGNVSQGAQEIIDELKPRFVAPGDLANFVATQRGKIDDAAALVTKTVFHEEHMARKLDGQAFDLAEYYQAPQRYQGIFSRYLDDLTVLINGIYWEEKYPRVVTFTDLERIYSQPEPKLQLIGDISCDVNGGIEATVRATVSDNPAFVWDCQKKQALDGVVGHGPVILAVDNLPAELPRDASASFSTSLMPFLPALAQADMTQSFSSLALPPALKKAVITHHGSLTPDFAYLARYI